ncbi:MAG TPA: hypothetical protein VM328_03765 [Fimbriimonadaceae bacterium]|nr:hypothetical protein [Fimbriimonadaceae bacterium]
MRRAWPLLFLAFLPLIPLHRAVFLGEAIGPFDQIRQMAPWNEPTPDEPWDVLQADAVLQFYVWRDLVFGAWSRLDMPFWNPYQLAGTPLLANSQSGGFYPLHILAGLLHLPTAAGITLLAWFHLFWAGLGVYLLTLRLGSGRAGALLAGASFSLSAFLVGWTPLASVISTASWIPWLLVFVAGCFGIGKRAKEAAGLAGSTAMMLLAGHLQFAAYGLMAAALFAIWLALASARESKPQSPTRRGIDLRSLAFAVAGVVAGGFMAMPQLKPVLEYSQFSHRRNTPTAEGYQAYSESAIKPWELAPLAAPTYYGHPRRWSHIDDLLPSYWPMVVKRGSNFAESAIGPGPLVVPLLFLLPFATIAWRRAGGLALIGLFGLLLALGTPLNRLLYFYAPGWSSTGSPGRAGVLFVLGACVLAGLAAGAMLETQRSRAKHPWLPLLVVIIGSVVLFGVPQRFIPTPAAMDSGVWARAIASPPGQMSLLLALLAGIGLAAWLATRPPPWLGRTLPVLAVLLLAILHADLVATGKPLEPVEGPTSERVAVVNDSWHIMRAGQAFLPPNTPTLSRIHDLAGYDSLLHRDTVALLNDINGQDSAPQANGNMMFVKPTADPDKLAQAGVREVWSHEPLDLGPVLSVEQGFFRYGIPGPGRVSLSGGSAEVHREDLDSLRVRVSGEGLLLLRDRAMPGWIAYAGGQELKLSEGVWRGVQVPPGTSEVDMRYVPPGLRQGLLLGGVGLLITLGLLLLGRRAAESDREAQPQMDLAQASTKS